MSELIKVVLENYMPNIITIVIFMYSIFKVCKEFKSVINANNIDELKANIKAAAEVTEEEKQMLMDQMNSLVEQLNEQAKKYDELLTEITKIEHKE